MPMSKHVALHIYSSTKPPNLKIAHLQKGLILVNNGAEVIGEGTGFGVPVLKYYDETYFSSSSALYVSKQDAPKIIHKEFFMDAVSRDVFKNVKLESRRARMLIDHLSSMYQKNRHFRFITLKDLLFRFGIRSSFSKVSARGKVAMTYVMNNDCVRVNADFTCAEKTNLSKIFILNEQSSMFFRVYSDSDGQRLIDDKIGAWDEVKANWATFTNPQHGVGFSLSTAKGSILRRGREFIKDSMDWVGLDYEIGPDIGMFKYAIKIVGA